MIGKVKFFNESKGYGFITVTEGESEKDYFMHVSGLTDDVKQGDTVLFELEDGKKGQNAVDVHLVADSGS